MFKGQSSEKANNEYQYEDNDMIGILKISIRQRNITSTYSPDYPIGTTALSLKHYLEDERREHQGVRTLLIPYNIGGYHWVGILLAISSDGKVTEITSLDPLKGGEHSRGVIEAAVLEASAIYPELKDKSIKFSTGWLQKDVTSCGPLTIENLLLMTKADELPGREILTEKLTEIRASHIELYRETDPGFYERQRDNINRVASIQKQQQWLSTAGTHFTLFELKNITEVIELLQQLEGSPFQKGILEVFSGEFESHKKHLDSIREKLLKIRAEIHSKSKEEDIFYHLITILFGLERLEAEKSNFDAHYKLPYEAFNVIAKSIYTSRDKVSKTHADIQKQIEEDEKLARALHSRLWNEEYNFFLRSRGASSNIAKDDNGGEQNKRETKADDSQASTVDARQATLLSLIEQIRKASVDFEGSLKDFKDTAIQRQLKNLPLRVGKGLERIQKLISQKSELKRTLQEEMNQTQTFIESKIGFIEAESNNYSEKIQAIELLGKMTDHYLALSKALDPKPEEKPQSDSRWRDERLRLELPL